MDTIHVATTRTLEDAAPPRFDYEWEGDNNLIMHYKSHCALIDLMIELAKGIGKFYGEELDIAVLDREWVKVTFK